MVLLKPKLFTIIKFYKWKQFVADLNAGVIVGVVALPLAIAFAIASGVPPSRGIITAVVAGFIISLLGGSRVQIGGPTGAFVIIIAGIVEQYGLDGLTVATIMAGIILIIIGVARFGSMIKFIPFPVIAGFTSGIAIIIFSAQIGDFFGLQTGSVPADFFDKWELYLRHFTAINPYALAIGAFSILIILFWQRFTRRIPGAIIALVLSTMIVAIWRLPVETIGSRFGELSVGFSGPTFSQVNFKMIRQLIGPAATIAILAGIESLLSAMVADGMIGKKHRSNMELVANGIANIVAPLCGGIPATGALARTATNVKNGGRTPIAGIIHAITLLALVLIFGKWAANIPLACLAAVLVVIAYNMSEWRSFTALQKGPRSDVVVLWTTFLLTVLVDLTAALGFGMVIAAFLFMHRMAEVTNVNEISAELDEAAEENETEGPAELIPPGAEIYEITGPLFFGAAYKFEEAINQTNKRTRVLVISMRNVPAIDSTGLHMLEQMLKKTRKQHISIVLAAVQKQPLAALKQFGLVEQIGRPNICANLTKALEHTRKLIAAINSVKDDSVKTAS